ncbi:hypothetical protein CFC21_088694 [Triticum aestivum]|uniref:Uncharacterized protein n=3 Tax=Triticum TaxID=4564 RepID=A0A9R0YQ07_TRITD|nr:uncharacterized protein LOC119324553 [Triticum dicoccoides]XP_044409535.1 uncharacterized protein LOC123134330 [Triticum aestivum]KAF7085229.1 hypothetical protein CFC21_088694 [Triticum aestivum]VAI59143.1 unnamed protein product [Triticum turgidum subsp. durum]
MDSPQKKLGSMDGELLPVSASATVAKKTLAARLFQDHVLLLSAWALFTAFVLVVSCALGYAIAYALDHFHVPCSQASFFLRCHKPTDAEAAEVTALVIGMLCCATLQAAAAALALLLPCRRPWVRCALAYLALALTIAGHCMYAVFLNHFANPGDLFFKICWTVAFVVLEADDMICLLVLLLLASKE